MARAPAPRVTAIPVDRSWIGAPAGTWTNPTVWLFALALVTLGLGTWAYLAAVLPSWAIGALHAVALYVMFTPLHESMHGLAHRHSGANAWIGRVAGACLTLSLPLFRAVHYEHHSHTNDPSRDPDGVVARRPRWLLPLWCAAIVVEYRLHFYRRGLARTARKWREGFACDLALAAVIPAAVAGGFAPALWTLWLGPALVALLWLAFAFDYLPHYPYDTDARYFDTRIYGGAGLNVLLLGQNQHLIHHLWTTIPWFRYRPVLARIHDQLVARGCRIGWKIRPLPRPDDAGSVLSGGRR